jgi:hypothetical protein
MFSSAIGCKTIFLSWVPIVISFFANSFLRVVNFNIGQKGPLTKGLKPCRPNWKMGRPFLLSCFVLDRGDAFF